MLLVSIFGVLSILHGFYCDVVVVIEGSWHDGFKYSSSFSSFGCSVFSTTSSIVINGILIDSSPKLGDL